MMLRFAAGIVGLTAMTLFSGCSLLPERDAKNTFMLPSPELASATQSSIPMTLRVLTPHTESPLQGTDILVNPEGQIIQAYAGARWSKPTPILVRDHWVEGLRQNGSLKAIVTETSQASSNLSLSSELTRFHVQYLQGQPAVTIQLDVQLLETRSRKVLETQRFRIQQKTPDKPIESVITGFGAANQALTEELVAWLLRVSREIYEETDQARPLSDTGSSTRE
jgi:cholesterol transport system auxiliary component